MGAYITRPDVEAVFGVENVRKWSALGGHELVRDDARVDAGIAWGESYVEDKLRDGPYELPLAGNSTSALVVIKDIMATLAGIWLYRGRGTLEGKEAGGRYEKLYERVMETLKDYATGQMGLDATLSQAGAPSAPFVVGVGPAVVP